MILKHELAGIKEETQDSAFSMIIRIYLFIYYLCSFDNANINEELMCMYVCMCLPPKLGCSKKKNKEEGIFNVLNFYKH